MLILDKPNSVDESERKWKEIKIPVPWGHITGKSFFLVFEIVSEFLQKENGGVRQSRSRFWHSTDGRTIQELGIN